MQLAEENPNETRHAATIEQFRIHRPYVIGKRVLSIVRPVASRRVAGVDTATGGRWHQRGAHFIDGVLTVPRRWYTRYELGMEFLVLLDSEQSRVVNGVARAHATPRTADA